jgi:predicted site-specific integrase-resolvase
VQWEDRLEQWREELDLFERLDGWVSLPDAAARTGVSRSALRTWYRSGQIRSRLIDGPHGPQRLVHVDEVAARADASPRIRAKVEGELSLEAQVALLRHQVTQLEIRLAALEGS